MNKVKLDDVDHQILDILIDNTRVPFTDISKRLLISAGTVHVRVKKMEEAGIIKGSSLNLDYVKLGYSFIAYIGIFLEKTKIINEVIKSLNEILANGGISLPSTILKEKKINLFLGFKIPDDLRPLNAEDRFKELRIRKDNF